MKRAKREAIVASHAAVGGRHTFKFGKHESLQTRWGALAILIFAGTI
jgi:hypothetical protein